MATIVTDTSFLFSLFGSDAHTAAAKSWATHAMQPILVTALNRYEFGNAMRFAAFRKVISQTEALNSIAAFDSDLRSGMLQPTRCDLADVLQEAERLSELHTLKGGHRSFDVLHVATGCLLRATTFLTFDANQRKLAHALGILAGP